MALFTTFFLYSIAVTVSRFGDNAKGSSLLSYFGHSMLTFNYGLADSIHTYMNGEYFFSWFFDKLGLTQYGGVEHSVLGTHFGTAFYTFVGAWYLDFGPLGTFIIAIIFPFIISLCFRYKKSVDIADIYMFLFYMDYLVMGVFVIGRGNALVWLMAFLIYGIFKIIK
jgi:oligosaccharide repeat unit polymerase